MFCFIKANFLRTGKILLPEHFSDYELLSSEAKMVGMTKFVEALQEHCGETLLSLKNRDRTLSEFRMSLDIKFNGILI